MPDGCRVHRCRLPGVGCWVLGCRVPGARVPGAGCRVSRVLGARVPGAWGREPDELPVSFFVWYGIPSVYPP